MELPPLSPEVLAKVGADPKATPIQPRNDFGINIPKPLTKRERAFGPDDYLHLFSLKEAVTMTFIPQMLTALAVEQAEAVADYCSERRLSDFKKHTRKIRECVKKFRCALRDSYGPPWLTYNRYLDRLRQTVQVDLFQTWCTFTNEASRQYVGCEYKDIPARVYFMRLLLVFADDYDKEFDAKIADKIGEPCKHREDPWCLLISALCVDIVEELGLRLHITDPMLICVKVLVNRCKELIEVIMAEEDAAESAKS